MSENIDRIVEQIRAERASQDRQWGGPEHDDSHSVGDWMGYIDEQMSRLDAAVTSTEERERLLKIAALAVAAIESMDRKSARPA